MDTTMDTTMDTAEQTLDRLAGDWWIFQLRRGHRYATDDLLTAWTAGRAHPRARQLLDLGAGVGSVGLLTLMQMSREARLTALELQQISVDLLRKTVELNGLGHRVRVVQADLRAPAALGQDARFELITANPPYLPVHSALHSPHPQRAAARLELNGDVFDYCQAAARLLAPRGRFCFCHAAADERPEQAVDRAGLSILTRQDVVFRQGRPPTIALFTCALPCALQQGARQDLPPLIVRHAAGPRTAAYREVRRALNIEA